VSFAILYLEAAMNLKRVFIRSAGVLVACLIFIAACHLLSAEALAQSSNWPGWRGPAGTGISTEKNLPT